MSFLASSSSFLRAILCLLLIAIFTEAQNSEDGQGSGAVSSGQNAANAGSAGTDTSGFSMSTGSFVAIIVVVVVVAVLGIASATLFFVAKKRQWEIRKSLKRMSRRLTGRSDARTSQRQSRRQAVRMQSPQRGPRDLEKGTAPSKITSTFSADTPTTKSGWTTKVWSGKNTGRP
ncbi:MAG: hypothetical protein Q9157_005035 [Trypethelium eluteriae]